MASLDTLLAALRQHKDYTGCQITDTIKGGCSIEVFYKKKRLTYSCDTLKYCTEEAMHDFRPYKPRKVEGNVIRLEKGRRL